MAEDVRVGAAGVFEGVGQPFGLGHGSPSAASSDAAGDVAGRGRAQ
jgi:hypothetical protein